MSELLETLETLSLFLQNRSQAGGVINDYDVILMNDAAKAMLDAVDELKGFHFVFARGNMKECSPKIIEPAERQKKKCRWTDGVAIKPDGIHPLSPHVMVTKEIHRNATVEVEQCENCGHVEISWYRQEDTEDEILEKM